MTDNPQTTPSIPHIIAKIVSDPYAAAVTMCEQEDKLIAAEAEIERLRGLLLHYGDQCGCDAAEMRRACNL